MLSRQQMVISLLEEYKKPMDRMVFVKLMFLLKKESVLAEDHTFYDFVPYKFGPFSFALYRELETLISYGYLKEKNGQLVLGNVDVKPVSLALRNVSRELLAKYAEIERRELLSDIYQRYRWYATASELKDLCPASMPRRRIAAKAVYTIGYEGKSVDGFFNHLLKSGIRQIIDVRANPISRKYGFARKSLNEISNKLGFQYLHRPELGISTEARADLSDFRSYQVLFARYEKSLSAVTDYVQEVATECDNLPSVLLCVEADVRCCHRGRLAPEVAKLSNLEVCHI